MGNDFIWPYYSASEVNEALRWLYINAVSRLRRKQVSEGVVRTSRCCAALVLMYKQAVLYCTYLLLWVLKLLDLASYSSSGVTCSHPRDGNWYFPEGNIIFLYQKVRLKSIRSPKIQAAPKQGARCTRLLRTLQKWLRHLLPLEVTDYGYLLT